MEIRVEGIDHVAFAVRDVQASVAWYESVLGLQRWHEEVWGDVPAIVGVGSTSIALFPGGEETMATEATRSGFRHVAFRATRQAFDSARAELGDRGISYEFQDHRLCHSIYLRDPDGTVVEITTYEVTAGTAR